MSFASILSGPAEERPPRRPSPPPAVAPTPPSAPTFPTPQRSLKEPELNSVSMFPRLERKPSTEKQPRLFEQGPDLSGMSSASAANQVRTPIQPRPPVPRKSLSHRDIENINKIMDDIEDADKSDVEGPGFEAEFERYVFKGKKRAATTQKVERHRCKVWSDYVPLSRSQTNEIASST